MRKSLAPSSITNLLPTLGTEIIQSNLNCREAKTGLYGCATLHPVCHIRKYTWLHNFSAYYKNCSRLKVILKCFIANAENTVN